MKSANVVIIFLVVVMLSSCLPPQDPVFEEPIEEFQTIMVEAEDAIVNSIFMIGSDPNASSGKYLFQPSTVSNTAVAVVSASINVNTFFSDNYSLWVRLLGPSPSEDAIFVGINSDLRRIFPSQQGSYEWKLVSVWSLVEDSNTIDFGHAESNTRVDMAVLTNENLSIQDLNAFVNVTNVSISPQTAVCGNNVLETGEECDDGSNNGIVCTPSSGGSCSYCTTSCRINQVTTSTVESDYSLRGNPDFTESQLTPELQILYRDFWYAFNNSDPSLDSYSKSANQYNYGRGLFLGISMAEMVFRQTGDLKILDRMYELSLNTYNQLDDTWTAGTISPYYDSHLRKNLISVDGYRNWRFHYSCTVGGSDIYCGRDNHRLEEALSHGMAAGVMYALHVNRDLESPKGYDYGIMADRWLDYLKNDFEAKWRERYGRTWPQMPYFSRYFTHTNMAHLKTHYYMGRMLKEQGNPDAKVYLDEANKMIDQIFTEPHVPTGSNAQAGGFVETQTPIGPAYIWAFGTPYNSGADSVTAAPATYARYFLAMVAELHFDDAYRFNDTEVMRKLSRTVAHFVLDTDPPYSSSTLMLSADVIGGDGDGLDYVNGMQSTSYRGRNDANRYAISTFGLYALWDDTGRIDMVTEEVRKTASGSNRRIQLQAFRFISAYDKEYN